LIRNPNINSIDKLVETCSIRDGHHDVSIRELKNVLSSLSKDDFPGLVYHKECYTTLTNKKTIDQIVKRSESKCLISKPGRPQKEGDEKENVDPASASKRSSIPKG